MQTSEKDRTENYKDMVTAYYEVITEPFRKIWGEFFHEAFFDNPSQSIEDAMKKTNKLFLKDAKINPNDTIIDLGCGIGSLSRYIAKKSSCQVLGINISKFQIKKAEKITKEEKVMGVSFKHMDIMEVDKLDQKFDAALSIAVNCHLPNKEKAINNIYSILRKGGRLIMSDFLQKNKLNAFEKELLIEPFNHYWNYPYMESVEGYIKIFKKSGFKIIQANDVSKQVKKNFDIYYQMALDEVKNMNYQKMLSYIKNPLIVKWGKKYIQIAKNQFYANLFGKICAEAGVFRYGYFIVEK